MRISLVSEHANPLATLGGEDAGGQNVHVAQLAAGLVRRGHDVVVHTRRDSTSVPTRVTAPDGYVVDHVDAGPPVPMPKDQIAEHLGALSAGLAERWEDERPDVVHAHFWMSGLAAVEAVRLVAPGTPVLQTFHALGVVKRRHQGAADTSPPFRTDVEQRLLRDVDRVIATCSDEVAELEALGMPEGKASVIPCGVDTRRFVPAPGSRTGRHSRSRLLSIGRLVPRKGVETLIRALPQLPDTELIVAGGPPRDQLALDDEACRLLQIAQECGVADRVELLGGVPPEQVPELMPTADVVVTGAWYEPFGIVPVEAMACGVPVVATAVGGHLDTVLPGRTGELVPPRDPDALAATVGALLADPARRRRYGEAGRRRAESSFDWRTVVARTELVYTAAIGTAPSSAHPVPEVIS